MRTTTQTNVSSANNILISTGKLTASLWDPHLVQLIRTPFYKTSKTIFWSCPTNTYRCFADDIRKFWQFGSEELQQFLVMINTFHHKLKLTSEMEKIIKSASWTSCQKSLNRLSTIVYRKKRILENA